MARGWLTDDVTDAIAGHLSLRRQRGRIGVDGIRPAVVTQRHEEDHHQHAEY